MSALLACFSHHSLQPFHQLPYPCQLTADQVSNKRKDCCFVSWPQNGDSRPWSTRFDAKSSSVAFYTRGSLARPSHTYDHHSSRATAQLTPGQAKASHPTASHTILLACATSAESLIFSLNECPRLTRIIFLQLCFSSVQSLLLGQCSRHAVNVNSQSQRSPVSELGRRLTRLPFHISLPCLGIVRDRHRRRHCRCRCRRVTVMAGSRPHRRLQTTIRRPGKDRDAG